VGKTRLLTEFATAARTRATVLVGGCLDLVDGAPPYWAVTDALGAMPQFAERGPEGASGGNGSPAPSPLPGQALLGALLPPGAEGVLRPAVGGPAESGRRAQDQLFGLVLSLLQQESRSRPVVLMIEDLHWSDRSTRDLLTFLVSNLRSSSVLFVATYRSDALIPGHPLHGWLAEVLRRADIEALELDRLTRPELARQLTSILGGPPRPDVVEAVWQRSEGNAFFAEELLASMVSGQSELPPTLRQVLLAKINLLSAAATQVLGMVAVAGSPVRHDLLAALGILSDADLLKAVRECVDHQVLLADARGGGYAFRHNLLRDAVAEQLLPAERAGLHRACARALAADPRLTHGSAATELALHWAAAGEAEEALPAAIAAAAAAEASYGFAEAHTQLERALELWPQAPGAAATLDRPAVALHAASLANLSGDHERATALAREAAESLGAGVSPSREAPAWERLGQFLWDAGQSEDALEAYARAAELASADAESPVAAQVLGAQAAALMQAGRYEESRRSAAEALDLARRTSARAEEMRMLAVLGFDLAYLGDPGGIALLHDARRIAEEDGALDGIARSYVALATLLSEPLNAYEEALSVAEEGLERVRALGLERFHGVALQALSVNVLFRLGRWSDADLRLQDAFGRDPGGTAAIDLLLARAKISLGRGDLSSAAADIEAVKARTSRAIDPRFQAPVLTLEAGLALWEGRLDDARDAAAAGLARLVASQEVWFAGPLAWHGLRAEADRAQDARTRGASAAIDAARATAQGFLDHLGTLTATLDSAASAVHRAAALYRSMCEGEWSRIEGSSSPEIWGAVAAAWDEMGQPYPAAYARWRLAEALLARQSRSAQAAEALRGAHAAAVRLGAEPLLREVRTLAGRAKIKLDEPPAGDARTAAGVAPGSSPTPTSRPPARPVPAAAPTGNAARLSPRELEVLRLVAKGHTNREIAALLFISEKTAGVHISHILEKLAVRSRVEATTYAHRLGLLEESSAP
jgi:DNA-binding NarL/FixJ family response regulator